MTLQLSGPRRAFFPLVRHALLAMLSLAMAAAQAAGPAGRKLTATELFNYAEKQYPALFPVHASNQSLPPYTYRQYPTTGNYLGVADGSVYLLGPASGGTVKAVGKVEEFYCTVVPKECAEPPERIDNAAQLLDTAARGANSLFLYQTILTIIMSDLLDLLAPSTVSGRPTAPLAGTRQLVCVNGGKASLTVTDPDDSHTLTPGDKLSVSANDCVMNSTSGHPQFTGTVDITVIGGTDTHNYWASTEPTGGIELRIDMGRLSTDFGVLHGVYRFRSSWPTESSDFTETVSFEDVSVFNFSAKEQYSNVTLWYTGDSQRLATAEGAITIDDSRPAGLKRFELSVRAPMNVDRSTGRPRPITGALRLSGHSYTVDLSFLGNRLLNLAADNGADGSVDVTMTNVAEKTLDDVMRP